MKKIATVSAPDSVDCASEGCDNYQWAREFLKNSYEAGATKIEFGIEWQAVERLGVYRRMISDNGCGMTSDQLRHSSRLHGGAKRIGGAHDNFGMGAKTTSLPWNPKGIVVISYRASKPSMIQIGLRSDSADHQLVEFQSDEGPTCAINPTEMDWRDGINWAEVAPAWARTNGTTVVFLGSEEAGDTVLGNPKVGENAIKGLSTYLNSRFWDLSHLDVVVAELRNERKSSWPTSPNDRDDARRANNRRIMGARHYVADITAKSGKLAAKGTVPLDQWRVLAHWWLWEGDRPAIHSYARRPGYIAVKYMGELFELSSHREHFRSFGITHAKIQQNLFILMEPQLFDPQLGLWGVHLDQSPKRLSFTGNGHKDVPLPTAEWGNEFSRGLPEEIRQALRNAERDAPSKLADEEICSPPQEEFDSRRITTRHTQQPSDAEKLLDGNASHCRGNGHAKERQAAIDEPLSRYTGEDEFEEIWHPDSWIPDDSRQQQPALVNRDSPVLLEAVKLLALFPIAVLFGVLQISRGETRP